MYLRVNSIGTDDDDDDKDDDGRRTTHFKSFNTIDVGVDRAFCSLDAL
jgi:hypothetical protein